MNPLNRLDHFVPHYTVYVTSHEMRSRLNREARIGLSLIAAVVLLVTLCAFLLMRSCHHDRPAYAESGEVFL